LVSICFFGSVARGEASPNSDVDVLAIAERLPKDYGLRVRETNGIHESLRKGRAYRRRRSKKW
jgi:predicted nucleotidyltransferase